MTSHNTQACWAGKTLSNSFQLQQRLLLAWWGLWSAAPLRTRTVESFRHRKEASPCGKAALLACTRMKANVAIGWAESCAAR